MEIAGSRINRIIVGLSGLAGLALVYILQNNDFLALATGMRFSENIHFVFNRSLRITLNDCFMLMLIWAFFHGRGAFQLALWISLLDLFVLFPIYLLLKLPTEGVSELSSPFLSQIHRLIVNPVLLIVFMAGMIYQQVVFGLNNSRIQEDKS